MNMHRVAGAFLVAVLCAGCQSTSIRSAWFDTDFAGPPMRRIVVVGDVGAAAANLALEDAFAEKLRAVGVDGVAGRTLRLDDTAMSDAEFGRIVAESGAQGLLLVRLLGVDTRTQVSTMLVSGGMGWGRGPWGSPTARRVPVTQVHQYDVATVETKLFDVKTRQLVWAATTNTLNPRSVQQELPAFSELVIGQLSSRNIVAPK